MLFTRKKYLVTSVLVIIVAIGSIAGSPAGPELEYKNLKVLPRNVSSKTLQSIMIDDFEDGLGVACAFCHAEQKGSHKLDYASDAKPEKEIARTMMRMTMKINQKYFLIRRPMIGDSSLVISCNSCHQGQPRPAMAGAE
ncbi:MAG TPA: c-type cytochrome [Puia sp.]|nr:c-type cytochrome [Puia sp.]